MLNDHHRCLKLREKCANTEFFLVRIFLYSVQIQENTDQKKTRICTLFTQCDRAIIIYLKPSETLSMRASVRTLSEKLLWNNMFLQSHICTVIYWIINSHLLKKPGIYSTRNSKFSKKLQRDIHGGHLFSAKQENKGNIQQLRNSLREEGVVGFVTNHYGKTEGDISSTVTSR